MKKRCVAFGLSLLVLVMLLCGCIVFERNESPSAAQRPGLNAAVADLPELQSFSDHAYEHYEYQFAPVDHALLFHDGTVEEIAPDDPRLFRLLNFIAASESENSNWLRQGYVEKAEIEQRCENSSYMEVYFQSPDVPGDTVLGDVPEIWILGAAVMIDQNDIGRVEEHWPYMELYYDLVDQGIVTDEQFSIELSSNYSGKPWLDLLVYAGFLSEAD